MSDFLESLKDWWEWVAALLTAGALAVAQLTGGLKRLRAFIRRGMGAPEYPRKTIVAQPRVDGSRWHMGKAGGAPAMQVIGEFDVTNLTEYKVILTSARLKRPKEVGRVDVPDPESNYVGQYFIPPKTLSRAHASFWIVPPCRRERETLVATVGLVDQFGNVHWVKNVRFPYH